MITPEDLLTQEIVVFSDRVRIDVQTRTPGITFDHAWKNRKTVGERAFTYHVVSVSDLIASKRAAGRAIDVEDVAVLEGLKDQT